jgi:hypothetical protein
MQVLPQGMPLVQFFCASAVAVSPTHSNRAIQSLPIAGTPTTYMALVTLGDAAIPARLPGGAHAAAGAGIAGVATARRGGREKAGEQAEQPEEAHRGCSLGVLGRWYEGVAATY